MALPTQKYLNIQTGGLSETVPTKEVTDSLFSGLGLNVTDDFNSYLTSQGLTGTNISNLLKYICQYDQSEGYKFPNRLCYVVLNNSEYYIIQSYNTDFNTLYFSILKFSGPALPGVQVNYYVSSQGGSATEIMSINNTTSGLPQVTTSDVGKFLRVSSSGKWAAETVPSAEGGTF